MRNTKMNIGVFLSKNYNTIKLELLDEEIEHIGVDDLSAKIQDSINYLKTEINKAHDGIDE